MHLKHNVSWRWCIIASSSLERVFSLLVAEKCKLFSRKENIYSSMKLKRKETKNEFMFYHFFFGKKWFAKFEFLKCISFFCFLYIVITLDISLDTMSQGLQSLIIFHHHGNWWTYGWIHQDTTKLRTSSCNNSILAKYCVNFCEWKGHSTYCTKNEMIKKYVDLHFFDVGTFFGIEECLV